MTVIEMLVEPAAPRNMLILAKPTPNMSADEIHTMAEQIFAQIKQAVAEVETREPQAAESSDKPEDIN